MLKSRFKHISDHSHRWYIIVKSCFPVHPPCKSIIHVVQCLGRRCRSKRPQAQAKIITILNFVICSIFTLNFRLYVKFDIHIVLEMCISKCTEAVLESAVSPKPQALGSSPSAPARKTAIAFAIAVFLLQGTGT